MKRFFVILAVYIAICASADAQKVVNGITFPPKLKRENAELLLNGAGVRKKMFFKLYVAGLYVHTKTKDAGDVVNGDKEEAMYLTITSGMINSGNMSEAIEDGFKKSMNNNLAPLQSKIDLFIDAFRKEGIREGDVFEMWYEPITGVMTTKNGKFQSVIAGWDFKKALFGIWFSDNPVDDDLKKALLGL
jgi:hypothetical protein